MTDCRRTDVTLGGGAMRGPAHAGLRKFLAEERVLLGRITGVSIGSIVAAFWTNNFSADDMSSVFICEASAKALTKCLRPPGNPLRWANGVVDMLPLARHLVGKYELTPNRALRIVAFDLLSMRNVVFEGEEYDLALALAASCSVPGVMRPVTCVVDGRPRLLVDGGTHHLQPSTGLYPAIVAKLIDSSWLNRVQPDREQDFIVSLCDSGESLARPLTRERVERLVEVGYRRSSQALSPHIVSGAIATTA